MNVIDRVRAYFDEQGKSMDTKVRSPEMRTLLMNLATGASMAAPAGVAKEAVTTIAPTAAKLYPAYKDAVPVATIALNKSKAALEAERIKNRDIMDKIYNMVLNGKWDK